MESFTIASDGNCGLISNIDLLADCHILIILSYLVDNDIHDFVAETKQKKEHDISEYIFKRSYTHSHTQILNEMAMRREILRPARELYAYALVCKKFRDVIANPTHENLLYSGMIENLMSCYFLTDSGPNVEDVLVSGNIFTKLFEEKNQEMLT